MIAFSVSAIEPYTEHLRWQEVSLRLNQIPVNRVQYFHRLASDVPNVVFNGWNARAANEETPEVPQAAGPSVTKLSVRVDETANEDVLLLKVDVEAFEPHAMASAAGLFKKFKVSYCFIEVTHHVFHKPVSGVDVYLRDLETDGHTIYWMPSQEDLKLQRVAKGQSTAWLAWIKRTSCNTAQDQFCQENILTIHDSESVPELPGLQVTEWRES